MCEKVLDIKLMYFILKEIHSAGCFTGKNTLFQLFGSTSSAFIVVLIQKSTQPLNHNLTEKQTGNHLSGFLQHPFIHEG